MHLRSRILLMGTLLAFSALSSCRTSAPAPERVTDSVFVEKVTILRDTVLTAPAASASLRLSSRDLANAGKAYKIKNAHATASVTPLGDSVRVDCQCDSVAITAQLRERYETALRKQTVRQTPEQSFYCPWWMKALSSVGVLFILLLVGGFIYKFRKA